jgi:RHS repeat-associated protein
MQSLDAAGGTSYMLMSTTSGANGDYNASQLSSADTWNVGIGSGAFTYSYPIGVPPAVAGAAPSLSLNYNSQSVDGRTSASNGQVSKVGEGWSFEPGFIERRFHSCRDEGVARDDFCWSGANEYFISFLGHSGELVRTGTSSNQWRIRGNDPAWQILSFTACCSNGDNDGEYFVVITPDGTKYWFGYGIEPRNTPTKFTNSAWTVPVYGNTSGEPCYQAVTSASWCQQAYRWNVDRVQDTNDNVMSLFYAKETNKYSRQGLTANATEYVRSGHLTEIEYGLRHLNENGRAYAQVRVTTTTRCKTIADDNCTTAPTSGSVGTDYPDVPLDLMCDTATCGADQTKPTFWSTKAVKSIQTEVWNPELSAYEPVTTYTLKHSFPPTGDGSSPSLWLTDIQKTGEYGSGSTPLPSTRMAGTLKPNRVNTSTNDPLYKYRIGSISTELGARVEVTYGTPHPCPVNTLFDADTNPYDCYPVWHDGAWIPFHKYVVTDIDVIDVRGGQPARNTRYEYVGPPAWHYADSTLAAVSALPSTQTWNDWRGYEGVRVRTDNDTHATASSDTDTRYLVFRGMHGDKLAGNGSKTQDVTDSLGAVFNDFDYRAGQVLEVKTMEATSGSHLSSSINRFWAEQTVNGPNGFQSHDAYYVRPSRVISRVKNTATGAWRNHQVDYEYSPTTGLPVNVSDDQQPGDDADDTCVRTWYTTNRVVGTAGGDSEWLIATPFRVATYSDPCADTTPEQTGQTDTYYDGHAGLQDAPSDGNVTAVHAFSAAGTASVAQRSYDDLGRVTSVKAPGQVALGTAGKATLTSFSPSYGYPYNGVEVTDPSGHITRTIPYAAFGTARRVIDVSNDDTTLVDVDHLGRTTSVTEPGNPAGKPGLEFQYRVQVGLPNLVTTRTLTTGTSYVEGFEYFDGLGRSVQRQYPKANDTDTGRRIAVTRYDPLGHVIAASEVFTDLGIPGTDMADVALDDIPRETRTGYDSAGRLYVTTQYERGVAKITNRTHHTGWGYTVDAPVHSDVDYETDVFGRVTKVVERPASGTISTKYAYMPTGQLDTITAAATTVTNFDYDWLGRRTKSVDPDQGTWNTTYTADGDVATVTDANVTNGVRDKITYAYDASRRRTHVYSGSVAPANLLAQWTYGTPTSTVLNGKGRLLSATSYANDTAYTVSVTGYDNRGRVSGKKWDVPGFGTSSTADDTYTFTYDYAQDDSLEKVTLPAAGGLPVEEVTTVRNGSGLPVRLTTSLNSTAPYVAATTYLPDGAVASRSLIGDVTRSYTYDSVGRLETMKTTAPLQSPLGAAVDDIEDVTYAYDADNNVVAVRDGLAGTAETPGQRECFEYDPLNRLTKAYTTGKACSDPAPTLTHGSDPYNLAYAYDDLGNITQVTDGGVATVYDYTGTTHKHAPVKIGTTPYTYDANGATKTTGSATDLRTFTWNRLHQLVSVSGEGASSFVYDADGNRLLRKTGDTTTLYLDGMEVESAGANNPVLTAKRYYGGMAVRWPSRVQVLLHNRQNSTSIAYDPALDTAVYQRYKPYGARRGSSALAVTERRFLDKTEDDTGLIAMGARYYDPAIGRFISVDPLADLAAPQSLAGYSYALNNPATLSDPTGLLADPDGAGAGPGCEHDCADPEILHRIRYDYVVDKINVGEAPEDEVFAAGNFSEQEREQLLWAMNTSPCSIAGDRSACAGNSHFIFTCQMSGGSDCTVRGAARASEGEFVAAGVLSGGGALARKAADSISARFGRSGRARRAAQGLTGARGATHADDGVIMGTLRQAARGKGNFGVGKGTRAQAELAGHAWVGEGYTIASDGRTLISRNGLRQYRPPTYKPHLKRWQANFESRHVPRGAWQANGHLDIMDPW